MAFPYAGSELKSESTERRRYSSRPRAETPQARAAPQLSAAKTTKTTIGRLLLWTEMEEWQQHGSELIHSGYRRATPSIADCVSSWFYLHNETVNIFSHILGAALFLALPLLIFSTELLRAIPPRYQIATSTDILVCSTYFLGVAACFSLSVAFHTLMSHSQALYMRGMQLDFQGVLLLMWGATVPLVYYTFPCDEGGGWWTIRELYIGLLTLLAAACSAVTFMPRFSGPQLGPYRAALFGTFGVGSFALPIGHGVAREGWSEMWERVGLGWILATVVCNGVGVVLYTLKFPERWYPGRFDIFGASHQLMHICVVAAALMYTCAVVHAFDCWHTKPDLCHMSIKSSR